MLVVGLHDEGDVAGGDFAVDASMMAPPADTDVGGRKYAGGSLLPRSSSSPLDDETCCGSVKLYVNMQTRSCIYRSLIEASVAFEVRSQNAELGPRFVDYCTIPFVLQCSSRVRISK